MGGKIQGTADLARSWEGRAAVLMTDTSCHGDNQGTKGLLCLGIWSGPRRWPQAGKTSAQWVLGCDLQSGHRQGHRRLRVPWAPETREVLTCGKRGRT